MAIDDTELSLYRLIDIVLFSLSQKYPNDPN